MLVAASALRARPPHGTEGRVSLLLSSCAIELTFMTHWGNDNLDCLENVADEAAAYLASLVAGFNN
jgi:hypothetical protein